MTDSISDLDPQQEVRSETRRQISHSVLYLVPVAIGNLIPLLTLPIFTRILSKEEYGVWALANVYAVFVGGLASFGLPSSYERNFFQYRKDRQEAQLLYSVLACTTVTMSVCALATWLIRDSVAASFLGGARYGSLLFWSFCTTAVAGLKAYYMTYLRNSERASAYVTYTIAERLLSAVIALLLVAWWRIGVIGLVFGQ